MSELICYCFGYTKEDIQADIIAHGTSTIEEKIIASKQAGGCNCLSTNPKGR